MKSTNAGSLEEVQQPVPTEVVWEMPMPDGKEVNREVLKRAPQGTTTIIIPDGVEKIEDGAFNISELAHFKKVVIPGSIKKNCIRDSWAGAFRNCQTLEEVILEKGLERIDDEAFQNCRNLKKVNINNNLKEIGLRAFQGCQNLETLKTPGGTELKVDSMCDFAFEGCESLKDISNLKTNWIGSGTFTRSGIESFYINYFWPTMGRVGVSAFEGCENLTKVILPPHKVHHSQSMFSHCYNLELLVLSDDYDQFSGDEQAALKEREFIGIQPGSQVHIQASSEYLKDKFNKMLETDRFSGEDGRVKSEKIPLLKVLERIHTGQFPKKNKISELMRASKELSLPDILKVVKEIKSLERKNDWVQWCGSFLDGLREVTEDAGDDPLSHTCDLRGAAEVSNMPTQQADEDLNKKIEVMLKRFHDESLTLCDFMSVCMAMKDSNNPGPEMTTTDSGVTKTGLDIALCRLGLGLFDKDLEVEGGAKSSLIPIS
ncbi:MAG: leucine-rich repeat domain-containing protein [Pseudomonadota bacterium]|nr:leucine-rich repeat domain-containing protein [Pseudomonadota bacterium]